MMFRRLLCLILIIACALSLAGCWDYTNLDNLVIVAGLGLDVKDDGQYELTAEIAVPGGGEGGGAESTIYTADAATIYGAVGKLEQSVGGRLHVNHCNLLLIGEAMAKRGIGDVLQYALSNSEIPNDLPIVIASGTTAKAILSAKNDLNPIAAANLLSILKSNSTGAMTTRQTAIYEAYNDVSTNTAAAVLPTALLQGGGKEARATVSGVAFFRGGNLAGTLDGKQTLIYNLLCGKVNNGMIDLPDSRIAAKIGSAGVSYDPRVNNRVLTLGIRVSITADVYPPRQGMINMSDPAAVAALCGKFGQSIEAQINGVIQIAQAAQCDIFRCYDDVANRYPGNWPDWRGQWGKKFAGIAVSVSTNMTLAGTGQNGNGN